MSMYAYAVLCKPSSWRELNTQLFQLSVLNSECVEAKLAELFNLYSFGVLII
jgi:hypothetical protein